MIGFIIICILAAVIFFGEVILTVVIGSIKLLYFSLVILIESIYKGKISKYRQNDLEKYRKQKEIDNKKSQEENIKKQVNFKLQNNLAYESTMINGIYTKINQLTSKYPYSDFDLIEKYKNDFFKLNYVELDSLETDIARSHFKNINKNDNVFQYTYADIENRKPLDHLYEYPIYMQLYKINIDYVIAIVNVVENTAILYQSRNYKLLLELSNNIVNEINRLKQIKNNISSIDLDKMVQEYNTNNEFHQIREERIINRINESIKRRDE